MRTYRGEIIYLKQLTKRISGYPERCWVNWIYRPCKRDARKMGVLGTTESFARDKDGSGISVTYFVNLVEGDKEESKERLGEVLVVKKYILRVYVRV